MLLLVNELLSDWKMADEIEKRKKKRKEKNEGGNKIDLVNLSRHEISLTRLNVCISD